jgi:undecaprenyl-diphosphatase
MGWFEALILGLIEGLTEYIPVSSTGHLILANTLFGLKGEAYDAFAIVVQFGAILAVLALYKDHVCNMILGIFGKNPNGRALFLKLMVAFIPAVIAGLALEELIEALLFSPIPVAAALILGGIAMILVEAFIVHRRRKGSSDNNNISVKLKELDDMTYKDAIIVGIAQCFALWPGTSRSMCTILGAQLRGFSDIAAAEISFLLALPTLGGATVYKLLKDRAVLVHDIGLPLIIFGNVVAFVVALFAVKWFVGVVSKHGMFPFGIYRIVVGVIFLTLALMGYLSM